MLTPQDVLHFIVVPLIVSTIVIALTWRWAWGGPLAAGAGFVAAFAAIAGWQRVWSVPDATGWLIYAGILFTVIALLAALTDRVWWLTLLVQLLAAAVVGGVMLKFNFNSGTWSPITGGLILLTLAVISVIDASSMHWRAAERPIVTTLAMSMIAGIGGLIVMTLADQSVGEGVAAMGVALLPVVAKTVFAPRRSSSATAIIFAGVLVVSLACSVYASEVPLVDALIIAAAAPLFSATGLIPQRIFTWRLRGWQHGTIRLVITAIPLLIVLALAVRDMQKENTGSEETSAQRLIAPVQLAEETIARSCSVLYNSMNCGSGPGPDGARVTKTAM